MKSPTNYSPTDHMYIHLNACKQMTGVKLLATLQYMKPFNCEQTDN